MINYVASKNLPVFLSTGMASHEEINEAIDEIHNCGNHKIILLHCMTSYPTKINDANLEMIKTLKKDFSECIIGYSDHTLGPMIPALSICYGSKVIEKHFTFDKKLNTSRDHRLSLNEDGFRQMIENIRIAEFSQGQSFRLDFDNEKESVKYARRSIVSTKKISENTILSSEMLA